MLLGCPFICSCVQRFVNMAFYKLCEEFPKFTVLIHFWTNMIWLDFEVKRCKDKGPDQTKFGPKDGNVRINHCYWLYCQFEMY